MKLWTSLGCSFCWLRSKDVSVPQLASKGLSRCTRAPWWALQVLLPTGPPAFALSLGLILPDYQQRPGRRTPCNTGHSTSSTSQESNERGWTESFFSREQARIKEMTVKLFAESVFISRQAPWHTIGPMPAPIETGCEMATNKAAKWAVTVFRRKRQS